MSLEALSAVRVYTASRHSQARADTPASVTVVTAQQIEEHGYRTLADVLAMVRGFFTTNDRNYSSVGVRGFARPGDFNTRVLLLVDGHRLNDNIYDQAMLGTEFPMDVALIDRIEIIRGPVSALYGSNALFAVINIFTKHGRELAGWEFASGAGSQNVRVGRISYGQQLERLEFLISGSFYGSRGNNALSYPELASPETNNGVASHLDGDQLGSALLNATLGDFTLRGLYGTRTKEIPTASYDTVFNAAGTATTDDHSYADLEYKHTFVQPWEVRARGFYDRKCYQGTYVYPSVNNPNDAAQTSPEEDFSDGRWWGVEGQVSHLIGDRNRAVAGMEYRDNFHQSQTTWDLNPFVLELQDGRSSYVAAVYGQDDLTISRKLKFDGEVRWDHSSQGGEDSVDPRVALIYEPREATAVKLTYGQAFRLPTVYERYYSVAPNTANPALTPEKIRTTELIWEESLTQKASLSASVFSSQMKDLITQVTQADGSLQFENVQNVNSNGLELELSGRLTPGPAWTAIYSFQETRDADTKLLLSNSPRTLGKLLLSEEVPRTGMVASMDAAYRSRIEAPGGVSVSPFTVVNVTVLRKKIEGRGTISASVYNLLGKRYADPAPGANPELQIPQDGRTFRVEASWRLGKR